MLTHAMARDKRIQGNAKDKIAYEWQDFFGD